LIAILASILFPVFAQVRARARRTACLSNLHQLGLAHQMYLQDYDEKLPAWSLPIPAGGVADDSPYYWTGYLQPYLKSPGILNDPDAVWPGQPPTEYRVLSSYVLLSWKQPGRRGDPWEPWMRWPGPPMALGDVARPTETIQWMDGWTTTRWASGVMKRHGVGLNVTFVDGHAGWMSEKAFWRVAPDGTGAYWLYYGSADR
jgi:prepilin-type processing-associated H-X9-DG protein